MGPVVKIEYTPEVARFRTGLSRHLNLHRRRGRFLFLYLDLDGHRDISGSLNSGNGDHHAQAVDGC